MTPLFLYLLKVNIALLLFFLTYRFGLRRLTFYTLNRFYLLFAIGFSSVYPLINLSFVTDDRAASGEIIYYLPDLSRLAQENPLEIWNVLAVVFWSGVVLMALRFLVQCFSLMHIHFTSVKQGTEKQAVRIVKEKINPFSFFRNIYINPLLHSVEERRSIIEHERVHVKEWHTADILAGELNRIFYWFNPGAWLMMTAIRENLEFITDRKVLRNGADARAYQYSLVRVSKIPYASSLANNFNFSHLKIRITMMDKKPSSELHLVKYLVLVPFVAAMALAFNVSKAELKDSINDVVNITELTLPATDTLPDESQIPPPPPAEREVKSTPPEIVPKEETRGTSTGSAGHEVVRFRPPVIRKKNDTSGNKVTFYKAEGEQLLVIDTARRGDLYGGKVVAFDVDKNKLTVKEPTRIRLDTAGRPLVIIDGKKAGYEALEDLPPGEIYSIDVLKDKKAVEEYGGKATGGVLIITTRREAKVKELQDLLGGRQLARADRQKQLSRAQLNKLRDSLSLKNSANGQWLQEALANNQKILADRQKAHELESVTVIGFGPDSAIARNRSEETFDLNSGTSIDMEDALVIIDGKISPDGLSSESNKLNPNDIKSISILKGGSAILKYGEKGKKGAIEITTKD